VPGVTRPRNEGVTRPLDTDGVMRPLCDNDVDKPEKEGVVRPPREEATEEGLWMPPARTIGAESLVVATKTPRLGGQIKYCLLYYSPIVAEIYLLA